MSKKLMVIMLSVSLILVNISGVVYGAEMSPMVYTENTESGNIGGYRTISVYNQNVSFSVGYVESGKILVVSAIPSNGNPALNYIESIGLSPSPSSSSGGWYPDSAMSYFKITSGNTYTITVKPKPNLTSPQSVEVYMYTVDYINGFQKYDAIEGTSGAYNYVVSNRPEMLGGTSRVAVENNVLSLASEKNIEKATEYEKTIMIDGTERILPKNSSVKFVKKGNEENKVQSEKIVLNSEVKEIIEKINNDEKLYVGEVEKYYDFIEANNLGVTAALSANATSQLGEYGYYLHKSKVNGNANIFWEHVNKYGADMYYGILLQNTSGSSLNVTLNKRSYDSFAESNTDSMTSIWADFFRGLEYDIADISGLNTTITIPGNSARWVALYKVNNGNGYNIFNGQVSLSIKNSDGSTYTGSSLYSYSFIMTDWTNSAGLTMYQNVQNNIGNGIFTRAGGAGEYDKTTHISGSGNGARICKRISQTIDITGDRYSFLLTGFDAPNLNSGELMSLYHDGPTSDGTSGYTIPNGMNYGVVYKISFGGFNSTNSGENIKLKLNFSKLTNPNAVAESQSGMYAMVHCPTISNTPYTVFLGNPEVGRNPITTYPYTIPKNQAFDMYVVVGGMSSLPLEVQFVAE